MRLFAQIVRLIRKGKGIRPTETGVRLVESDWMLRKGDTVSKKL